MADDPKTDMTRYYYRPGTTEPELRPEIAKAEAEAAKKADAQSATDMPAVPAKEAAVEKAAETSIAKAEKADAKK
jgi:hypothetical protein